MTETQNMKKIGLIINPISGMGGSVGLKGTDGTEILEKAINLGAKPNASERAKIFLHELEGLKTKIIVSCPPNIMGESIVKDMGFKVEPMDPSIFEHTLKIYETTNRDTQIAAKELLNKDVSIIIFVGGDGTAKDILNAVEQNVPCLGIPAGVKIHSSVFSINPQKAAQLTLEFLWDEAPLRESEVLDIDEEEFRNNRVVSKLYGYLLTPYSPLYSQPSKMASPSTEHELDNQESIAHWVIEEMDDSIFYLLGPGTTTRAITNILEQEKTLLGVDLMKNKKIIAMDLNEREILEKIGENPVKLIVTPIGNQGFVFGRGNLQLSGIVLEKVGFENIIIICTKYKLSTFQNGKLRTDTRDPEIDRKLRGLYRILVDYGEYRIISIE